VKVISLEKTNLTLPEAAELAKGGPVILTRAGKPLATIKQLSASEKEALALSTNPRFRALMDKARRSLQEEGGISLEDLRQELGLPSKPRGGVRKRRT